MPICPICSKEPEGAQRAQQAQRPRQTVTYVPPDGTLRAMAGLVAATLTALPTVTALSAQTLTQDEALRLAFPPPAEIERRTAFLTDAQLALAKALAGPDVEVTTRVVTYYLGHSCGPSGVSASSGRCGPASPPLGVAYFERHRVRTENELLMFVVSPEGRITRVDILEFREPPEYRASPRWLGQLLGRGLDDGLSLKGSVVTLTGATLTSRAVTRAARRVLALHNVIAPFAAGRP